MLASNPDNIRYNGTGRIYAGEVGSVLYQELGELEDLTFGCEVSTDQMKSTRNAARAVIVEVDKDRVATLDFGMREMSEENLKLALLGGDVNTLNQIAGYVYQTTKAWTLNYFLDLGHLNVFITKITGTITGTLTLGNIVTGNTSAATGKIAYIAAGYIILVNVSGTFVIGEQVEQTADVNYIVPAGIETLEDVCITDSTGATLRVNGTDYTVDPDYGYVRKDAANLLDADKLSYDYESVAKKYIWAMSAGSVIKKMVFVSDKDDIGPRQRYTFHKVKLNLNGDFPLIGEGAQILKINGTVLFDATQPSGEEYYKAEMM